MTAEEFRAECRAVVERVVIPRWQQEIASGGKHAKRCARLLAIYGLADRIPQMKAGDGR